MPKHLPDARPNVNECGEIVRPARADLPVNAVYDFWYPRAKEQFLFQTLRELGVRFLTPLERKGKWHGTKRVSGHLQATEEVFQLMEQRLDEANVEVSRSS